MFAPLAGIVDDDQRFGYNFGDRDGVVGVYIGVIGRPPPQLLAWSART